MDVKGISCSSCGSTDIVFVTSTLCKCNHCGSKFIVEEQNKTIINANNIKIVNKEDELVYQENFYSFEKVKDEKDFTRDILIFLALSNHTPSDIFKGHFTPIIERPIFFTKFSIDSDVQYSADLGHNQRETFVDRDMQGDAFTNVRTVTHWFFNKGFYQTTNEILTCNTDSEPPYDTNNYIFENLIKTKCKVVNIENANLNINDLVLPSKQIHEYVLVRAKSLADENCLKSLNCDYYRNYSSIVKSKISCLDHYVLTEYSTSFIYENQEEKYRHSTAEQYLSYRKIEGGIYGSNAKSEARNKSNLFKKLAFYLLLGFVILASIFIIIFLIFFKKNIVFFMVEAPVFIAGIVFAILYKVKYNQVYKQVLKSEKANKLRALKELLKEMSLRELSPNEERRVLL